MMIDVKPFRLELERVLLDGKEHTLRELVARTGHLIPAHIAAHRFIWTLGGPKRITPTNANRRFHSDYEGNLDKGKRLHLYYTYRMMKVTSPTPTGGARTDPDRVFQLSPEDCERILKTPRWRGQTP